MGTVRFGKFTRFVILIVIPVAVIIAFYLASVVTDQDLKKSLQNAALTLIFGAILGGMAKLLLDDFDRGRAQRADHAQFITNLLADLKAVYDQVERARILLSAHQSALTFGNEMRDLIEARVKLRNVIRALDQDPHSQSGEFQNSVKPYVESMENYLTWMIMAFQEEYKPIADLQRIRESRVDRSLKELDLENVKQLERNTDTAKAIFQPNSPWEALHGLKEVQDFIGNNSNATRYDKEFVKSLDDATSTLRKALRKIFAF